MALVSWVADADGDWRTQADWSGGALPGSSDSVVLATQNPHTVTHSFSNDTIGSLTASTDTLAVSGGLLKVLGTASLGTGLVLSGGTLVLAGGGGVSGPFTGSSGTLSIATGTTFTASGPASLGDGLTMTGVGTLATSGATTVAGDGSTLVVTGGVTWSNSGTVSLAGTIATPNLAHLVNAAGGVFDLTGDGAGILAQGGNSTFANAGLLAKTAGQGTSEIDSTLSSTGTIRVASGTLLLATGGTLGGTVDGAGTLLLGSGSITKLASLSGNGQILSTGLLQLAASTVTLGVDTVQQGGSIGLLTGATLTASASLDLEGGAIVTGLATLATAGVTTVSADRGTIALRGGLTWSNSGVLTQDGTVQTLNSSTLANAAGATWILANDAAGIIANGGASSFANAGLLQKTGGGGTAEIDSTLNSTGTILVASGTLLLATGGSLSGELDGPGTVRLGAASTTRLGSLSGSGQIAATGVTQLAASSVALGVALLQQGGTLSLLTGATLTTNAGLDLEAGAIVTGLATLATAGATTVGTDGSAIGLRGGLSWDNSGTVTQSGAVQTLNLTTLDNAAGALWAFTTDAAGIIAAGGNSSFSNEGVLAKAGGTGTSEIDSTLNSSGTIRVASGTLLLATGGTIGGTLNGAGTLLLGDGSTTQLADLAGNGRILSAGLLQLAASNISVGVSLVQQGGTIGLATAGTLTTTAALDLEASAIVAGLATLATAGATTVGSDGSTIDLRGGLTWNNTGAVTQDGAVQLLNTTTFANAAGASWTLASDAAGIIGAGVPATFTNAGLLEKSGGTGISEIDATLNSTGTIAVDQGGLLLTTGGSLSGVLNGAGALLLASGSITKIASLSGGGGIVSTGLLQAVAGADALGVVLLQQGGTLSLLTGAVLTTTGALDLEAGAVVTGLATLATAGATTVASDGSTIALRGGLTWSNTGTVMLSSALQTLNSTTFSNAAGGVFDLAGDAAGIIANGGNSSFANAGTLAKLAGNGTSEIDSTLNSTGTLAIDSGTLLLSTGGSIAGALTGAGTLLLGGASTTQLGSLSGATRIVSEGLLQLAATNVTLGLALVQQGGTIGLATGDTLTTSASLDLEGGAIVAGLATLATAGSTTVGLDGTAITLRGGATWSNTGTVTLDSAVMTLNVSTFVNAAGAVWNLGGDAAGIIAAGGNSSFANAGLLAKTGGSGTSEIDSTLNSTGSISIAGGTIRLSMAATLGGALSGAGTLELADGGGISGLNAPAATTVLLDSGTSTNLVGSVLGRVTMNQAALIATGASSRVTTQFVENGGSIYVDTLITLTLNGAVTLQGGATITGSGTLQTGGTVLAGADGMALSLTHGVWDNKGQVTLDAAMALNGGAAIVNERGGVFAFGADAGAITLAGGKSVVTNAGRLEKLAGGGISRMDASLNSIGTILVASGTLDVDGGGTISGAIGGAGTLLFGGGNFDVGPFTAISVAGIAVGGGAATIEGAASFSDMAAGGGGVLTLMGTSYGTGSLDIEIGTIALGRRAVTLAVTGAATLDGGGTINGLGTIGTFGVTTLAASGGAFTLEGGVTWINAGTATLQGAVQAVGKVADTIENWAGATMALAADGASIVDTGTPSTLSNAGTLAKLAGGGLATIDSVIASTGTITVASGTLDLDGGGTISGSIGGAGTLLFGGGTFSVASSTTDTLRNLAVGGGAVTMGGTSAIALDLAGTLAISGGSLTLADGSTLSVEGAAAFSGGGSIGGNATLTTNGAVSIGADGSAGMFSDGLTWNNNAGVTALGQIDTGGLNPVTINNEAGASIALGSDAADIYETGSLGTLNNAGSFAKTGGNGTSFVYASVVSTGALLAQSGTLALEFAATLSGTIGGRTGGLLLLAGGASTGGALSITDNGAAASVQMSSGYMFWDNTGTVADAGLVTLGDVAANGPTFLTNEAGATWDFTGDDGSLAVIGQTYLTNDGTLAKTGGSGTSTIAFDFTNMGTIDAGSGTLALLGNVSGAGAMRIEGGSTLELGQALAGGQTLTMAGSGAVLRLDQPASIAGPIQGFGAGDGIDLGGLAATGASIAGKVLSVTAGGATYTFTAGQSLAGLVAQIGGDGSGGSLVTLVDASAPLGGGRSWLSGAAHAGAALLAWPH